MFQPKEDVKPKKARRNMKKARRNAQHQAKKTRREAVLGMQNFASDLQFELEHLMDNADQKQAARIAHDLEKLAGNLERRAAHQLKDARVAASRNVWQTTFIAFLVGVLIGIIVRSLND